MVLLVDDPPRQIEADAGALAERLGGEERLEDALDDIRRDAGPSSPMMILMASSPTAMVRMVSVPLAAHRLDGIVDDVGPHLVEIAWVALYFGQGQIPFLDQLDGLSLPIFSPNIMIVLRSRSWMLAL